MRIADCGTVSVAAPSQRHVSIYLQCSTTRERHLSCQVPRKRYVGLKAIPQSSIRNPHSAFRNALANLAFKYPDQLLNRSRQAKLLACCTQTGSAQVLSLFRVQQQTSDG